MCRCSGAFMIVPSNSCLHISVLATHSLANISGNFARFLESISNIRPIMCLLSLGKSRSSRQGPFTTSVRCSPLSIEVRVVVLLSPASPCVANGLLGSPSLETVFDISLVDFAWGRCFSVPGVGGDANSLYELSVIRGIFHGNLRSDIQAKIIARDHMSADWGSYSRSPYTSGAKYGSDPTTPRYLN